MLPYPGSLRPRSAPGQAALGAPRPGAGNVSSSGCRARIVEGETSAGIEGLGRLGANWWDLMGMTRTDWESG